MRVITQEVYTYDELSTEAQQRVHNDYVSNIESEWHDSTLDDAKQIAAYLGFAQAPDVYFTGFASQGDGACFVGRWHRSQVNVEALKSHAPIDQELHRIAEELAKAPDGSFIDITHTSNYCHENTMQFSWRNNEETDLQVILDVHAAFKRFAKWIYRQLETEYSHRISLEAFEEQEADSGNEYYEDGRLYTGD